MKINLTARIAVLTIILIQPCMAAEVCPDYNLFLKEINPTTNSWGRFYTFYKSYPQNCDDGFYGEGYSDFVVQSLGKYWKRFDELVSLTKKDPSFQIFVIKHVDATTDIGDLRLVLKNARERCLSSNLRFCKEIEKAALTAIKLIESEPK